MESTTEIKSQVSYIKGVIEALLFVNERPVTLDQIKSVLDSVSAADVKAVIQEMIQEYKDRNGGMVLKEIAGGFQLLSNPDYANYIRNFYKTKHKEKLSKPALETLAIVAYKQPVTRADVELIRGVNSDGVMAHLLSKELVKVVGRKDVPGRPFLYGTTKQFLEYFGLKSLETLPKLEEFPSLEDKAVTAGEEGEIIDSHIPVDDEDVSSLEKVKQTAILSKQEQAEEEEIQEEVSQPQAATAEAEEDNEKEKEDEKS